MAEPRRKLIIAPSILSADFARLAEHIKEAEDGGAEMFHIDVMDGHFVPNITIGPCVVKALRRVTSLPLDAHLMIERPLAYVDAFADAGSDIITFHIESHDPTEPVIRKIREKGKKVGIAVNPDTPAERTFHLLGEVDLALVMSVFPGFGGQRFIPEAVGKIEEIGERCGWALDIAIDGGINLETVASAAEGGANIFVAGTAVFGAEDVAAAVRELKEKAEMKKRQRCR